MSDPERFETDPDAVACLACTPVATESGALHNDYCWSFCIEQGRRFLDCDCSCHEAEQERLVVRGSDGTGVTVLLEQVYDGEDPAERLRVWSDPDMSAPFHHDVHLSRERVTTTYERVEVPR